MLDMKDPGRIPWEKTMACGYIAASNESATWEHVRYDNRCGIAITADVYKA